MRDQLTADAVQGRTLAEYHRNISSQSGDSNRQGPQVTFAYVPHDGMRWQHRQVVTRGYERFRKVDGFAFNELLRKLDASRCQNLLENRSL